MIGYANCLQIQLDFLMAAWMMLSTLRVEIILKGWNLLRLLLTSLIFDG